MQLSPQERSDFETEQCKQKWAANEEHLLNSKDAVESAKKKIAVSHQKELASFEKI